MMGTEIQHYYYKTQAISFFKAVQGNLRLDTL